VASCKKAHKGQKPPLKRESRKRIKKKGKELRVQKRRKSWEGPCVKPNLKEAGWIKEREEEWGSSGLVITWAGRKTAGRFRHQKTEEKKGSRHRRKGKEGGEQWDESVGESREKAFYISAQRKKKSGIMAQWIRQTSQRRNSSEERRKRETPFRKAGMIKSE